jgi:hypothetical protein
VRQNAKFVVFLFDAPEKYRVAKTVGLFRQFRAAFYFQSEVDNALVVRDKRLAPQQKGVFFDRRLES